MSKSPPIRYAIYTRQSKQGLADFTSCEAQFLDHEIERRQVGHQRPQPILPRSRDVGQHGRLEEGVGPVEARLANGAFLRQERSEVVKLHLIAIRLEHAPQVVVVAGP